MRPLLAFLVSSSIVLAIILAGSLVGCGTKPSEPPPQFYVAALTTEAWFVLQDHPHTRAQALRGDTSGPEWAGFRRMLASVPDPRLGQEAIQNALAREQQR